MKEKEKNSYASILAQYEKWVQNNSESQPVITCKEQQRLMSEYQFETDKTPDADQTLGDGGDLEEVRWNHSLTRSFILSVFFQQLFLVSQSLHNAASNMCRLQVKTWIMITFKLDLTFGQCFVDAKEEAGIRAQ